MCTNTIIIIFTLDVGFTNLHTSLNEACIGEKVMFVCATSFYRLRWEVTFSNPRLTPVPYSFFNSHDAGRFYSLTTINGVQLNFTLVSNSMGVLNSTLAMQTSTELNNADIECGGTATKVLRFKLTGI